ncbi:MAG: sugar phosphate isomerase/epimerase family protein [Terrimicrobiaceae bacterium]
MKPGLVSVTFRQLNPQSIVDLCVETCLQTIEWGGDVHVPPGDVSRAAEVGELTRAAGLSVAAYGSYYRLASGEGPDFESVLAAAEALGAPAIRVWAGRKGSAATDTAGRNAVAADALRCADLAGSKGITLCYEFHDNTLTDTTESALSLLSETEHPFIRSLWQPPHGQPLETCLSSLRAIMPRLHHVHVFHWWPDPKTRRALADGRERWQAYVDELHAASKSPDLLLEFVRNDDPLLLAEDAGTLVSLLKNEGK